MDVKKFLSRFLGFTFAALLMPLAVFAVTTNQVFSDVPANHPNFTAIMDLKTRGIISGYPDGTFKPNQTVNRAEALKIILLGSGVDVDISQPFDNDTGHVGFNDVGQAEWFAAFVLKAKNLGVVQGYADGTFKPAQTVNLVENLKILFETKKIDLSDVTVTENPYSDASKDQWYAKYVQFAKDKKLIDDVGGKIFPSQGMTRAKLAEAMYRLLFIQANGLNFYGQVKTPAPQPTQEPTQQPPPSGGGGTQPPAGNPDALNVSIENFAFNKSEMTVAIGTTVRWTNKDSFTHTVTSDTGKFESGGLANGQFWEFTFNEEGTFDYHCTPHPNMKGKIIVKPAIQVPTI